ncbi:YggT family protein [Methylococcus sp. EFPC2]|uniref:YggT family protein n=1 Tax=Methylococcus sp. EFPC2 TaxID=2812648 RepID=UPI0019688374|nr:YggT family protein [Methylococcus sp. EFPC2]QSA96154.1 YggT family protein [Methylococcus sp. EFPC2]
MNAAYLASPAIFLVDTLFGLYLFALMLRFLLQWVEADFYNPISQFLVKLTHPPLRLLRRFIPSIGRIDTAAIVLMLGLQILAGYLLFLLQGISTSAPALVVWSVEQLLEMLIDIFFFAIIIRALLSWFGNLSYNPAANLLFDLTEPLLRSCRRLLPPFGGVDLTPLVALVAIQLIKMLAFPPLQQLAAALN